MMMKGVTEECHFTDTDSVLTETVTVTVRVRRVIVTGGPRQVDSAFRRVKSSLPSRVTLAACL
jgi:hypothetical protein